MKKRQGKAGGGGGWLTLLALMLLAAMVLTLWAMGSGAVKSRHGVHSAAPRVHLTRWRV